MSTLKRMTYAPVARDCDGNILKRNKDGECFGIPDTITFEPQEDPEGECVMFNDPALREIIRKAKEWDEYRSKYFIQ